MPESHCNLKPKNKIQNILNYTTIKFEFFLEQSIGSELTFLRHRLEYRQRLDGLGSERFARVFELKHGCQMTVAGGVRGWSKRMTYLLWFLNK